ncbi:MAG TPA: ABC-2 family transporter protein [Thermomicrobiaceae bacterium]|nr:ABC-2 family transporter protein [Thermomicrobiaceae bacterium]
MASASIGLRLVGGQVRSQLQYRTSFLLQTGAAFLATLADLLAILILFHQFHTLAGWTVGDIALLYGLVAVAWGLTDMVGGGFENLATLIRRGEFDRFLLRPVPAPLQVLAFDFQLRRLGRIANGLLALGLAWSWGALAWSLPKLLVLLLAIASSAVVFFTVLLISAAICFWTIESSEAQNIFTYGGTELASYPIPIYHPLLRGLFLYLVPLALTSYEPALFILGKPDPLGLPSVLRFAAPLVAGAFFALGYGLWQLGLRHYQSTGS